MRKIDLSEIKHTIVDENGIEVSMPYDVKKVLEGVMLATGPMTQQRLSMVEVLRNARITQKILASKDGFVLLEENEYQLLKKSFDAFRGFGKADVEVCQRVTDAETVSVEEKKA